MTIPLEIKSSQTMSSSFFDTLVWFQEQTSNTQAGIVVYGGTQNQTRTKGNVVGWQQLEVLVKRIKSL